MVKDDDRLRGFSAVVLILFKMPHNALLRTPEPVASASRRVAVCSTSLGPAARLPACGAQRVPRLTCTTEKMPLAEGLVCSAERPPVILSEGTRFCSLFAAACAADS